MICFKCGEEYDNSLSACPRCGAAAAMPVIPEMNSAGSSCGSAAAAPVIKAAAVIPENRQEPLAQSIPAPPISEPVAPDVEKSSPGGSKTSLTAILAVMLIVMTAIAVILFIDRARLKEELEDMEEGGSSTSSSSQLYSKSENMRLTAANNEAKLVFQSAAEVASEMEMIGAPVGSGIVCSSPLVGDSAGSLTNAEYTMYSIINITERTQTGIEWFVIFDDGAPIAAYASEGTDSKFIGSYPTQAEAECAMSFEEGKDNADILLGGQSVSANSIYGKK